MKENTEHITTIFMLIIISVILLLNIKFTNNQISTNLIFATQDVILENTETLEIEQTENLNEQIDLPLAENENNNNKIKYDIQVSNSLNSSNIISYKGNGINTTLKLNDIQVKIKQPQFLDLDYLESNDTIVTYRNKNKDSQITYKLIKKNSNSLLSEVDDIYNIFKQSNIINNVQIKSLVTHNINSYTITYKLLSYSIESLNYYYYYAVIPLEQYYTLVVEIDGLSSYFTENIIKNAFLFDIVN